MGKRRKKVATTDVLLRRVLRSSSYRGKHVILVHGKVYASSSGAEVNRLFDRIVREFPGETPTLAYIPQADSLVLLIR
jgi:hypothetical protein